MKLWVTVAIVLIVVSAGVQSQSGSTTAIYAEHAKVAAAYGKGGGVVVPYDAIASVPEMRIAAGHRDAGKPYNVEYHENETEMYYILDGGGTVVTGGTMSQDKASVSGGQSHRVAKGDVLVIPPKTPHWWQEVSQASNYLTVSIRKP